MDFYTLRVNRDPVFNFFKKDKTYLLPERYAPFISKEEYNEIIGFSKNYFDEANKIIVINEGEIVIESGEENKHCYLDNLIRKLYQQDKRRWKEIIYEHFDFLKEQPGAYHYFFKDFDYASQLLRILIKPVNFFSELNADYVYRVDLPGTHTVLVIEYQNQFRFCMREDIKEWNVPDEELFKLAIANNPNEEIQVNEYWFLDRFTGYLFLSGDYAAGMMLDLENNAPYAIGTYGSLVAIPAKGFAFVHAVESPDILELVEAVQPLILRSYEEDQGDITPDFYWYYQGKFVPLPIHEQAGQFFIRLPEELMDLFEV